MNRELMALCLMLPAIPVVLASNTIDLANKEQVLVHFNKDIVSGNNLAIDPNKIVTINADLNGDGMTDFWLLYPEAQCTSQECWGHVYLKTIEGYCFAGRGMKETDLNFGKKTTFKCGSEGE